MQSARKLTPFERAYLKKTEVSELQQFIEDYETCEEIPLVPFDNNISSIEEAGLSVNPFLMELALVHLSRIWAYAKDRLEESEFSDFCAFLSFVIYEDEDFPGDIRPKFYVTRRRRWLFEQLSLAKETSAWTEYFQSLLDTLGTSVNHCIYRSQEAHGFFRICVLRREDAKNLEPVPQFPPPKGGQSLHT